MALNFQNENKNGRAGFFTIVFLVCSLVLYGVYCWEGPTGPIHTAQSVCKSMTTPLMSAGNAVGNGIDNAATAIADGSADENSLSALKRQNEALRQKLAELEEFRIEALRLERLLNIKTSFGIEGVSASVIGRSGEAYSQTIMINVGSEDGVDVGQTVMGPTGVLGQIVSTTGRTSVVRLLTDPQSGAAALVQASRSEGIVHGSLDGLLYLEDLDSDAVVNVGDVILTSGQGGSYVSGLIIGSVVRIENPNDVGSQRIIISPNDSVNQLQDVIVVSKITEVKKTGDASSESSNEEQGEE